ncbi:MAG: hypothetical protein LQ348_007393 [Seirophora lacunosa]|nr:MAG: hypothetical protein LQ348_007393 [Seirophora lacunosa]
MAPTTGAPSSPRLKLVVRRLPPGLTEVEFETILGGEWKLGGGRVDWAVYKPGKISKEYRFAAGAMHTMKLTIYSPAKPSKPSRAYLNLTKPEYISALSDSVRNATFTDIKSTSKDSVLLGPPSVEFAPYSRAPRNRVRKDARQGTIDQDAEFIEFLESLTNPVPKPASVDQQVNDASKGKEKVTITPLIQYLKEKKANKGKENAAAAAKGPKHGRQDSKGTLAASSPSSDKASPAKAASTANQSPDKRSAQAIMVEKAARDAARILNKQTATANKSQTPTPASTPAVLPSPTTSSSPLAEKRRERGSASAAASILRRDLGIGTTPGIRGGRRALPGGQGRPTPNSQPQVALAASAQADNAKSSGNPATTAADPPTGTGSASTTATSTADSNSTAPRVVSQPPTGPAASRNTPKAAANPTGAPASTPVSKPNPTSATAAATATATQAFLKHANPSQGITEPLLEEAFAAFGAVKRVEIDRKKGSAYVDFEEPEGLQKAIKASPVKVAQGQVIVLERRIGPSPSARNVRGGSMMNNNGGAMNGRGGLVNQRGGMINHRGGGMPMAPAAARGGGVRGRGGFARGRGNATNAVNHRPAATATTPSSQDTKTSVVNPPAAGNKSDSRPQAPPKESAKPDLSVPSVGESNGT